MRLLGLMWMVTRWACYGFVQKVLWLVAARVAMGFFAVLGVGFFNNIKKGVFAYVDAFLTPCKGAFEKTTPCKV